MTSPSFVSDNIAAYVLLLWNWYLSRGSLPAIVLSIDLFLWDFLGHIELGCNKRASILNGWFRSGLNSFRPAPLLGYIILASLLVLSFDVDKGAALSSISGQDN